MMRFIIALLIYLAFSEQINSSLSMFAESHPILFCFALCIIFAPLLVLMSVAFVGMSVAFLGMCVLKLLGGEE